MPDDNVVIHVGLHKTGSSFLQRHFFPSLPGVQFVDRVAGHKFLDYLRWEDDFVYSAAEARKIFDACCGRRQPGAVVLLSDEQYYGMPYNGCALRKRNVDRLAAIFPKSRIVVVLRNPRDMLESLYLQYIKAGGSANWRQFLEYRREFLFVSNAYFQYGYYIQYLHGLFGKDRVVVQLYEDFRSDPAAFLNSWCELLGTPPNSWDRALLDIRANPSIAPAVAPVMRFLNKFVSSPKQPFQLLPRVCYRVSNRLMLTCSKVFAGKGVKRVIPEQAAKQFLAPCRESNLLLEELIGTDLAPLGYT